MLSMSARGIEVVRPSPSATRTALTSDDMIRPSTTARSGQSDRQGTSHHLVLPTHPNFKPRLVPVHGPPDQTTDPHLSTSFAAREPSCKARSN